MTSNTPGYTPNEWCVKHREEIETASRIVAIQALTAIKPLHKSPLYHIATTATSPKDFTRQVYDIPITLLYVKMRRLQADNELPDSIIDNMLLSCHLYQSTFKYYTADDMTSLLVKTWQLLVDDLKLPHNSKIRNMFEELNKSFDKYFSIKV